MERRRSDSTIACTLAESHRQRSYGWQTLPWHRYRWGEGAPGSGACTNALLVMRVALALSGGGARGAYQVGVLRALAELFPGQTANPFLRPRGRVRRSHHELVPRGAGERRSPMPSLAWSSSGAEIRPERRLSHRRANALEGGRQVGGRSEPGWMDRASSGEVTPEKRSPAGRARGAPRHGGRSRPHRTRHASRHRLTATDYRTNLAVPSSTERPRSLPWTRSTRLGDRQRLTIDHVMASSAIPIFFPAIRIGERYYADGCLRSMTPLSPAIHLGADRILAIGIRSPRTHDRSAVGGSVESRTARTRIPPSPRRRACS